jgi:hypothetical protein
MRRIKSVQKKKKKIYRGGFQTASIDNFQKYIYIYILKYFIYRGGYITASIDKSRAIFKPIRGGFQTASIDHITYKGGSYDL